MFIRPGTPPKDVALTLRKIAAWAEDGLLEPAHLEKLTEWLTPEKGN